MRVTVLAYEDISPFMLSTPLAVFGEPFLAVGHEVAVCTSSSRISATGGLGLMAPYRLEDVLHADMVILPGWRDANEMLPDDLIAVLRNVYEDGAVVVGLCLGAFGLAQAGLLDGRRATTHWARSDTLASRYPAVQVDPGALFIDEGCVVTSAGVAAGIDCCLHLMARFCGVLEANRIARHLVAAPQRPGEHPQLTERPIPRSPANKRVAEILEALRADPAAPVPLDDPAPSCSPSQGGAGLCDRAVQVRSPS